MRVFLRIAVGMMHSVHDGIRARIQERRALADECEQVKCFFPERAGREHFVRRVPVQEKRLAEKRQEPVTQKENQDNHIGAIYDPLPLGGLAINENLPGLYG